MAYLSIETFNQKLLNNQFNEIIDDYIFDNETFAFKEDKNSISLMIEHLSKNLSTNPDDIYIVGSAKIGFSLNPHKYPNPYNEINSDIDIAIINKDLFDEIWFTVLEWNYPQKGGLFDNEYGWTKMVMEDIYWGWFNPDKLIYKKKVKAPNTIYKKIDAIGKKWFFTFKNLSLFPDLSGFEISGRLYRTKKHAYYYHLNGLYKIKENIERDLKNEV